MEISFKGKSFCFTGGMRDLKREEAEKQARSRGALTMKTVNYNLDYLVVGSIGSPQWKFGKYGNKIKAAMDMREEAVSKLSIVLEADYIDSLAMVVPENSGEIDTKISVYRFSFPISDLSNIAWDEVESKLKLLKSNYALLPRVNKWRKSNYFDLSGLSEVDFENHEEWIIDIRFVKEMDLNLESLGLEKEISSALAAVGLIDGKFSSFESKEGSATYIRLLNEIPENYRIEQK